MTAEKTPADDPRTGTYPERGDFEAVLARLSPEARSAMLDDVLDAFWEAIEIDSLRPVRSIIRAWYVDTQVVSRPGFPERLAQTESQSVEREDLLERAGRTGT